MNKKDIIKLAHEAQFEGFGNGDWVCTTEEIEHFAALVATAATEEANRRANASWTRMCEKMVEAEREACAKVCEDMRPSQQEFDQRFFTACTLNANAIRKRTNT